MLKILQAISGCLHFCMWMGCCAIYVYSIYISFKADLFIEMLCMFVLPPFAQIYLFFELWYRYGFFNKYGIIVVLTILIGLANIFLVLVVSLIEKEGGKSLERGWKTYVAILGIVIFLIGCGWMGCCLCSKTKDCSQKSMQQITKVFDVEFGSIVGEEMKLLNKNYLLDIYEFDPKKPFRDYSHYSLMTSKKTKKVTTICAQKDFTNAKDAELEFHILRGILEEKYNTVFLVKKDRAFTRIKGECENEGQLIMIEMGVDQIGTHIVIFKIMDIKSVVSAMAEVGITREAIEFDKLAL